jgi:hypothetical protein
MWEFIWLGVISFLVISLLILNHFMKETRENFYVDPKDYTLDIVKSTKISQPPFPPCVGYVDEVVYAPSDVNANIVQIKADLVNLQKNIPIYVADGVSQQADLRVKGILRQNGFPLTDDLYAQNDPKFNCN